MSISHFEDVPKVSVDNEYYRFDEQTQEIANDAGYCLAINWNAEAITKETDANGFIVQEVAINADYPDSSFIESEHYFEAWQVEDGAIVPDDHSDDRPDDEFGLAPNGELFPAAIGFEGFIEYRTKVYWIPDDVARKLQIMDWKEGAVRSANGLKSVQYDEFVHQENLSTYLRFTRRFKHEFNLTDPDEAARRLINYMAGKSPAKDYNSQNVLLDAFKRAKNNPAMKYAIDSCLKECPDWIESPELISAFCKLKNECNRGCE